MSVTHDTGSVGTGTERSSSSASGGTNGANGNNGNSSRPGTPCSTASGETNSNLKVCISGACIHQSYSVI